MRNKVGIILFVLYLIQFFIPLKLPFLEELQSIESYKKWSGFFLFLLIMAQWLLSLMRFNDTLTTKNKEALTGVHKWMGALLPLVFYIHSTNFGFAALLFLSVVFFLNIILASLNTEKLMEKRPALFNWWLAIHILLSVLVVVLSFIHIWAVFIYN